MIELFFIYVYLKMGKHTGWKMNFVTSIAFQVQAGNHQTQIDTNQFQVGLTNYHLRLNSLKLIINNYMLN